MIIIEIKEKHGLTTTRTFERIIPKRSKYAVSPAIKGKKKIINYNIAECDVNEKEFVKSKSMKDLLGVNVVRSCMKIHDE